MKAIILAAGRGSRMGGVTTHRPKCLVELAGKPLYDWQRAALTSGGAAEIGVVAGYRHEMLARPDVQTFVNRRWDETNMVASLACAKPWLEVERCIVSYSDIVYPVATVAALAAADADIAITYDMDWLTLWAQRFEDPLSDAETFRVDSQGYVAEIGARATSVADIAGQYMGLLSFTPKGWGAAAAYLNSLPSAARDRMDMTSLLRALIRRGQPIAAVPVRGRWYEVDSETDLRFCERQIADQGAAHWLRAGG